MQIYAYCKVDCMFHIVAHPRTDNEGEIQCLLMSPFGEEMIFAIVACSDESELSWLEPELELKDFQVGSARLEAFFYFSSK